MKEPRRVIDCLRLFNAMQRKVRRTDEWIACRSLLVIEHRGQYAFKLPVPKANPNPTSLSIFISQL